MDPSILNESEEYGLREDTFTGERLPAKVTLVPNPDPRDSFGKVWFEKDYWHIECLPYVRMMLKRIFAKAEQKAEIVKFKDTPENARHIVWFLSLYPMEVVRRTALERRANEYEERRHQARETIRGNFVDIPQHSMSLQPREYQRLAASLTYTSGGLVLGDELGLGKTCSALALLSYGHTLPAVVVVPPHLALQWERETKKFLPQLLSHVVTKTTVYDFDVIPDVLIISYSKLDKWSEWIALNYRTVIFDEAHELRHVGTVKYDAAQRIAKFMDWRLAMTATPIFNYGGEFYNIASLVHPGKMGSWEEFSREWCAYSTDRKKAPIADPRTFGMYLQDEALMLRRTRADVGRELPAMTRITHEVAYDSSVFDNIQDDATRLAKIIVEHTAKRAGAQGLEAMKDPSSAVGLASLELDTLLRQTTGVAKAPYVAEFVRMLLEQGEPVVLFGYHHTVYDIWLERLKDFKPVTFTGRESAKQKDEAREAFIEGKSDLFIMSVRAGAGLDGLQHRCSTVVFGELDWSPGQMEQASGRIHRDGQDKPVFCYYLVASSGADPSMIDTLGLKREQLEGIRDPKLESTMKIHVDPKHIQTLAQNYLARKQ